MFYSLPSSLAIVVVIILILFLAYTSQYLFIYFEPGILSEAQSCLFNLCVFLIWWCYYKACVVDAAPRDWVTKALANTNSDGGKGAQEKTVRWCKKCQAMKPLRAHHCKKCAKCIPKMDHHCPWTSNCVSHLTFPHFIRFVFYCVVSMSILAYHLYIRLYILWQKRHTPAYLGPPTWALLHLLIVILLNSVILFALCILLCRLLYGLTSNKTMIESWEIERHESIVYRCRKTDSCVYTAQGQRILIEHQEFPYDIGIWKNMCQSMGTKNILMWFMPFGGAPTVETAGNWEVNGFDENKSWPPLDPDKLQKHSWRQRNIGINKGETDSFDDIISGFKARQIHDLRKRGHQRDTDNDEFFDDYSYEEELGLDGERGWTNSDGDRLKDYGVEEDEDE